jgi:membrane protein DedA with SNARE-associated domain
VPDGTTGRWIDPPRTFRDGLNALLPSAYSPTALGAPVLASLNDTVTTLIADHGDVAVFALMALGSACIPIPSEVTMLFGGALTSAGFVAAGETLSLPGVVLWGVAGTLVGSWLAYGVGYVGGRPLVDRFGRYLLIRPHEVDRAHVWFERHGEAVALYGRLVPLARAFVSLPAGVAAMPFWRFTLYTVIGSLPWCIGLAWLGHAFGNRWTEIESVLRPVAWVVALAAVIIAAAFVPYRWTKVRREYAALDAEHEP